MGLIRKTVSVGTLGIVSFRSKNEQLDRAERARADAETQLEAERDARVTAEARILAAELRVKEAKDKAAKAARQAEKATRAARKRQAAQLADTIAKAEAVVHSDIEKAKDLGGKAAKRGRRAARKARKQARKARKQVVEQVEQVEARISDAIDGLTS